MVYDEDMELAGSVDMVYRDEKTGKLHIYDWKRCREIKKYNKWQCSIHPKIDHIPDTNFWHYSLQLNMYKRIIERKYGEEVGELWLVCLHPNQITYMKYKVPILNKEMDALICELEINAKQVN